MNISETLLVTINLSDDVEASTVEIVTYLGQYRDVVNVFCGKDAEILYKALMQINKKQLNAYLEQLAKQEISEIENLSERADPYFEKEDNDDRNLEAAQE